MKEKNSTPVKISEPELAGEQGWIALDYPESLRDRPSFVLGDPSPDRLKVKYFFRKTDMRFFGKLFFGKGTQGPPGNAHGGSIAAVIDEAMGFAAWFGGYTVVAANISVDFLTKLPVNSTVTIEAYVTSSEGKKVFTASRIYSGEIEFAKGKGLYIVVPPEKFGDDSHYLYRVKQQLETAKKQLAANKG